MKEKGLFLSFLTLMILALSSCVHVFENSISGSGNVVHEIRNVGSFVGLKAEAGLNVYLNLEESSEEVEVVADENLQSIIRTEVKNGILYIEAERSIRRSASKDIYVSSSALRSVEVSSAAHVQGEGVLTGDMLDLQVSSAGIAELRVDLKILDAELSSAGRAELEGSAGEVSVEASSAGTFNGYDLECRAAFLEASSAGTIKVVVLEELSAEASSAGSISYMGNPATKRINTSSGGSVRERNN
jgi:hypothetical protein